ncbi:LysR family transcriptional regulator [Luteibacter sp. 3190]|uniref:LysR family transcriptional regulator n=1 Tax=Luteibacter sp. 3190 TaxID=2817736 RepID=UPI0028656238|nr:LysR family transcriptional regulator [Luteibacter sp. 3190]MDR6935950.1 DNA-binding transcriptional LysR family regulator [Luteibacter sp. 3190]
MDTLNGIASFVRSAESGSFAAAARALGLTPAAVGKNVARLEAELGVRLFQRTTRRLALTEAGEAFLGEVQGSLDQLRGAMANARGMTTGPAGVLRVALPNAFGREYIVPMLDGFLRAHPAVTADWRFDNRPVDLIAEGFDVAIGGGFDLRPGVVARAIVPAHRILVASAGFIREGKTIAVPDDLTGREGILIRSPQTGRIRDWVLSNRYGAEAPVSLDRRIVFDDPDAACHAAAIGMGIALVPVQSARSWIERGALSRVLPDWRVDGGHVSIYYPAQKLLPAKTRLFIDHVVECVREKDLAARFSAWHADVV